MKFLVISDLHVFSKPSAVGEPPSYFAVKSASSAALSSFDIKAEFYQALKKHKIKADYLICCGDIVHQADESGYDEAWGFLHDVKEKISASDALITAGNHDVDSRHVTSKGSPLEYLKSLSPGYPSCNSDEFNAYWARDFFVREVGDLRLLTINSSSAHGYKNEHEHGRLHDRALKEIKSYIKDKGSKCVNICICHHHPHRHSEFSLGEMDDLKNGQMLLDYLGTAGSGQWLLIHGHKHHPRLNYAQGSSMSPIVFAAGSFSARLYPELRNYARNQFYLIDIDVDMAKSSGRLKGEFQAWSWFATKGWEPAGRADGLPHQGGFGYRDIWNLVEAIKKSVGVGKFQWYELMSQFPDLRFLIPQDICHLLELLNKEGFIVEADDNNLPRLVRI